MSLKPVLFAAVALASAIVALTPPPANAGSSGMPMGSGYGMIGPTCKNGSTLTIYKPVTITKNININKNIDLSKNINITKNIDLSKSIVINKDVTINKSIVINKGGSSSAMAEAFAAASASASANASASAAVTVYNGSYQYVTVNNKNAGSYTDVHASERCEQQEADVVKAIHAVCVSAEGREFSASHMIKDTWVDSSYEGEIMRCIPGSHLKIVIGDVLQSDQGMAGTYEHGQVMECGEHEALRHYKDGMLKCAPAAPVPDCTERTNLRKYGTADLFFTFRTMVCVNAVHTAAARELDVTGLSLDGGVGDSAY